jgi:hypothetical protein
MKIFLGDFNAKVEIEGFFKPSNGNDALNVFTNDNG